MSTPPAPSMRSGG